MQENTQVTPGGTGGGSRLGSKFNAWEVACCVARGVAQRGVRTLNPEPITTPRLENNQDFKAGFVIQSMGGGVLRRAGYSTERAQTPNLEPCTLHPEP